MIATQYKLCKDNKLHDTVKRFVKRHVVQYADCSEQNRIIGCNPFKNKVIVIQAFAGTGKTTTLVRYAEQYPSCSILYLAYNKSLSNDAKNRFSNCENVKVMTLHAFALHHIVQLNELEHESQPFEINDVQVEDVIHFLKTDDVNQIQSFLNQFNQFVNNYY